jgi:hypothetical protein
MPLSWISFVQKVPRSQSFGQELTIYEPPCVDHIASYPHRVGHTEFASYRSSVESRQRRFLSPQYTDDDGLKWRIHSIHLSNLFSSSLGIGVEDDDETS